MPDDKLITESLPPVSVVVVGTGNGGVVPTGTIAETPHANQPNLIVTVVSPLVAIAIRFANVYVGSLVGILAGAMASDVIPAADFVHLLRACAGLALGGAVLLSLKDITTVLTGLEKRFPLLTGSV